MSRNIALYPWFQLCRSLMFWQAVWFLYFDEALPGEQVLLLAAISELATVLLEVPSGYMSDRLGRRLTLIAAMATKIAACALLFSGETFAVFAAAQVLMGASWAFVSGTDHALLYESLARDGRRGEIADHEVRAWRYQFAALGLSAAVGGLVAMWDMPATYLLTGVAAAAGLMIVLMFQEPDAVEDAPPAAAPIAQARVVLSRLRDPVLAWLFVFAVTFYVVNHVPYIFAQPILKDVLGTIGLAAQVPWVYGLVIAVMMGLSVVAGWGALPLKKRIGLPAILVLSIGSMALFTVLLAVLVHPLVILLIMARMVPSALAQPFLLATIQPRLEDAYRASYLSVQNLTGKLVLSVSLMLSAGAASGATAIAHDELAAVLPAYAAAACLVAVALAFTARRCLPREG